MAVLTSEQREAVWEKLMRDFVGETALTKSNMRAAVDATDNWIDANAMAYRNSVPEPARTGLTSRQLVLLFLYVAAKRYEVI
jgi:hypothetical protein